MGIENIVAGNGVGIAVTGMVVVVFGLLLTSGYIALLPRALEWAGQWKERSAVRMQAADAAVMEEELSLEIDPDLLVAIATVIDAERERQRSQDRQRITLREGGERGVWTAIGKMRTLSSRL
ncbi:MAG: OadG family protein [Gemmatimonadota bacterium]